MDKLLKMRDQTSINDDVLSQAYDNFFSPDEEGLINLEGTIEGIS